MRAVVASEPGGPEVLTVSELPDPEPGPGEVLVDVAATGAQPRRPPAAAGLLPAAARARPTSSGLECSGTVAAVGADVDGWSVGDEVCALLAGGGYADEGGRPGRPGDAGAGRRRPGDRRRAARGGLHGVVERVHGRRACSRGETLLVHGGAGGIGTFAIQLATALGARVFTTAGSAEKLAVCARRSAPT